MLCDYCNSEVIQDTWGWGYYIEDYKKHYWHQECIETNEGIKLND